MKAVVHILGARPNFIKAAPLIKRIQKERLRNIVIHTGQHFDYNMLMYADDTMIIGKRAREINIILRQSEIESAKYNMKLKEEGKYFLFIIE